MWWFSLLACTGSPGAGACLSGDEPALEVAQRGLWQLTDGVVDMGIPPQGGAPYAPFEVRMANVPAADAYQITMSAVRVDDDVEVGVGTYVERFVLANVGDNAGCRYTPDLHMRFFGYTPDQLDGVDVELRFTASTPDGEVASGQLEGTLIWTLGPMPVE